MEKYVLLFELSIYCIQAGVGRKLWRLQPRAKTDTRICAAAKIDRPAGVPFLRGLFKTL